MDIDRKVRPPVYDQEGEIISFRDPELAKIVASAEGYADVRLARMSDEERDAFLLPINKLLELLAAEYYEILDAESGLLEVEDAEIELRMLKEDGRQPH